MSNPLNIGFAGLGVMGFPMAGHLQKAGHNVTVFNRTEAKSQAWQKEYGGHVASTPKELASRSAVVFTCLGNDDDVRQVYQDPDTGLLAGVSAATTFVDHTTTSAKLAIDLAGVVGAVHGSAFMDAPVSGGESGAVAGKLTAMVGGASETLAQVRPLLEAYAQNVNLIGDVGSGQLCKMVNQICIAGTLQGLAEGVTFAQKAGLDIDKVVAALSGGAAGSWQLSNRAKTMAEDSFDFGFAIDWMRKDLGYCLEQAQHMGVALPMTKSVDDEYRRLQTKGFNRLDTSVLIRQFLKQT